MTPWQHLIALAMGVLCTVYVFGVFAFERGNIRLQQDLAAQQEEINRGSVSQQVGQNLLRELAAVSLRSESLRAFLTAHGYSVTVNQAGEAGPPAGVAAPAEAQPKPQAPAPGLP